MPKQRRKSRRKSTKRKSTRNKRSQVKRQHGGGTTAIPNKTYYWQFSIDPDVAQEHNLDINEITTFIESVLSDYRGWKSHGYNIVNLPTIATALVPQKDVLKIRMSSDATVHKNCDFGFLSCADMSINVIYLNVDRWLYGSPHTELPLDQYRVYLVSHEVGHLLGKGHKHFSKSSESPCYVMNQQTIANGRCKGNIFPLYNE